VRVDTGREPCSRRRSTKTDPGSSSYEEAGEIAKYGIYTRHTAKSGQRDNLVANMLQAAELLRDNRDCLMWVVNTTDEPDVVWVNVVWTSKEAHDLSLQPEEIRALIGEARAFLSEEVMPEQIFMTPVGGKGL
jgi:quinol monooxygenase YgiN